MNNRFLPARDYLALKAAFRDLVAAAGGPNRAATITRVSASLLSKYGAPHEAMWAPDDVVSDLEAEVGDPMVTRVRARIAGFEVVRIVEGEGIAEPFLKHALDISRSHAEVESGLLAALATDGVDPQEASDLIPKAEADISQRMEVLEDLKRVAKVTRLRRG